MTFVLMGSLSVTFTGCARSSMHGRNVAVGRAAALRKIPPGIRTSTGGLSVLAAA
jgi:hypothetical protein